MNIRTSLSTRILKTISPFIVVTALTHLPVSAAENPNGIQPGDPNPGSEPATILNEVDKLELVNLPGHKIYAGGGHNRNNHSYINLDIQCDGTGTYEVYYSDQYPKKTKIKKGLIEWKIRDDGARIVNTVVKVTEGNKFVGDVDITMVPAASSTIIVGQTLLERVGINRIVQHTKCDATSAVAPDNGLVDGYSPILFYKNPGAVPSPLLEELDNIKLSDFGGVKVFSGPDGGIPITHEYFNVMFDCDGTGTFEAYPAKGLKGVLAMLTKEAEGTVLWEIDEHKKIEIMIDKFTKNKLISQDEIRTHDTDGSDRIVNIGKTTLNGQVISRMVRYKECD